MDHLQLDGWLSEWVSFAGEYNESPAEFHLGVGMAILGAYLSRLDDGLTIGLNKSPIPLSVRLPSFLVGDSASGKGVAMNHWGGALIDQVNARRDPYLPWLSFDQGSGEKLAAWLIEHPWGLVTADEAQTLLGGTKEYNKGISADIINMMDDKHHYSINFIKRDVVIPYPRTSVIVASNPGWITHTVTGRVAEGGLTGRFMWWMGAGRPPVPVGRMRTKKEWDEIVENFLRCSNLKGNVVLSKKDSPAAFKYYCDWYVKHYKHI